MKVNEHKRLKKMRNREFNPEGYQEIENRLKRQIILVIAIFIIGGAVSALFALAFYANLNSVTVADQWNKVVEWYMLKSPKTPNISDGKLT